MTNTYYEDDYIDYEEEAKNPYEPVNNHEVIDEAWARKREGVRRKAPYMHKWLMILFWLMIASGIADLFSAEEMEQLMPEVYGVASIVSLICGIIYVVVLFKLSNEEALYRKSAYYLLGSVVLSLVGLVIAMFNMENIGVLLITMVVLIGALVVAFVSEYYEYHAHANVVRDADSEMAHNWEQLWKYYVRLLLGLLGCIVLAFLIPMIAGLIMIVLAIGVLIVSIMKYVYVYQTAKIFKSYLSVTR